jgi:ABC-type nitrate/sulfonate/bicarbonate transport system permease component
MVLLALMSIILFGLVAAIERAACPWYGRQH